MYVLPTRTGMHTTSILSLSLPHHNDVIIRSYKDDDDMEGAFPLHEGTVT